MKRDRFSPNESALRSLLKKKRIEAGLRQEDLASALGVPQSFVSKYESGERLLTYVETIQVCQALAFSPSEFLQEYLKSHESGSKL